MILLASAPLFGGDRSVSREEVEAMKARIEQLGEALGQTPTPDLMSEGDRPWYERIDFAFGATGVLQGTSGADRSLSPEGDVTDAAGSMDLEISMPVGAYGAFYTLFEAGSGDGIDGDVPTLSGFNDDADDDRSVRPTEVWYEHTWLDGGLRLRGGKVDLTTDFDVSLVANSEIDQFLSTGFVNNLAVEWPDDNGFGAMLWGSPGELWDIGIGIADADADWDSVLEDVFAILELGFKPKIADRQGNYRVYGWFNGKDHEDLRDPAVTDEDNHGCGLSFDQEIAQFVTLFARYGVQRERVSPVERAWSAGLQCAGGFYGRDDDVFGLAYGVALLGDDWEQLEQADGNRTGDESHLELYYRLAVNEHLSLSPDIQWVGNPGGHTDYDDVWVFGVRAQLSF
jgi:carbohydrate-selective porin OprB